MCGVLVEGKPVISEKEGLGKMSEKVESGSWFCKEKVEVASSNRHRLQ